MKRLMLTIALLITSVTTVWAGNSAVRIFLHGQKQLSGSWYLVSHNCISNITVASDWYAYMGPRYKYSRGFVEGFVGYTLLAGTDDESVVLSSRILHSLGKVYVWADAEWYPKWQSAYTSAMLEYVVTPSLEVGLESETYSLKGAATSRNIGPNVTFYFSSQMNVGLTYQLKPAKFGGNFLRLTTFFTF